MPLRNTTESVNGRLTVAGGESQHHVHQAEVPAGGGAAAGQGRGGDREAGAVRGGLLLSD